MPVGKLYMTALSPPCRAVMITAKALGVELELIEVSLLKGEHMTPEFLQMNPAHAVPTYADSDGTTIGDSHAIMAYLVGRYGEDDRLYPKDLARRAAVDQRLHFDGANVYALHLSIVVPLWTRRRDEGVAGGQLAAAEATYAILNAFLDGHAWVAPGDRPTIADFSLATSVMAINVVAAMDCSRCGNIVAWLRRIGEETCFKEVNQKGQRVYERVLKSMQNNDYSFMDKFK